MARRATALLIPLLVAFLTPPAVAQRRGVVLHEPIPADPREDVAFSLALDGDLPAAINTPRGLVPAPDPARPVGSGDAPYSPSPRAETPGASLRPDRDTRRPDALPYDDPFSPSTAPFKRLSAFDKVDSNYLLSVREAHASPLGISPTPAPTSSEEQFFADMVIDLAPGRRVRIPSVGPGARVLRAHAGVGSQDVKVTLYRDGADNWFVEGDSSTRARLVMELSIPRAALGGEFGNASRAELPLVPALPPNVASAAAQVAQHIGVSPQMAPREIVTKLVSYFRSFQDSEDLPNAKGDIYLDLALQQKGVCRHRAFAFMVTALSLGIPTRMVSNEAHAWVEVHDGRLYRRIDLGGAGRMLHDPLSANVPYEPPPDPFSWPQGSTRGEELADRARRSGQNSTPSPTTSPSSKPPAEASSAAMRTVAGDGGATMASDDDHGTGSSSPGGTGGRFGAASGGLGAGHEGRDERPPATISLSVEGNETRRGSALRISGRVVADGEPCGHVVVGVTLRPAKRSGPVDIPVGMVATDEHGAFAGALVLSSNVPLGDYEAYAFTTGDSRCGRGETQ